jgi:hypothetical protein
MVWLWQGNPLEADVTKVRRRPTASECAAELTPKLVVASPPPLTLCFASLAPQLPTRFEGKDYESFPCDTVLDYNVDWKYVRAKRAQENRREGCGRSGLQRGSTRAAQTSEPRGLRQKRVADGLAKRAQENRREGCGRSGLQRGSTCAAQKSEPRGLRQ